MTCNRDFFAARSEELASKISYYHQKSSRLSLLRFVLFALAVICAFLIKKNPVFAVLMVLFIVSFTVIMVFHGKVKRQFILYKTINDINDSYLARIDGDFSALHDSGKDLAVQDHAYAGDLDLFGDVSLFARFNISDTYMGRHAFADRLLDGHPEDQTIEELVKRQAAVGEFIEMPVFLQEYQAVARLGKITSDPQAFRELASDKIAFSRSKRLLLYLQLLLWLPTIVFAIVGFKYITAIVTLTCIVNLFIWFFSTSPYRDLFFKTAGIARQTDAISDLYSILENHTFKSDLINELIGDREEISVSSRLKALSRALLLCSFRSQPLLALILNAIGPFDLLCAYKLYTWADKHGESSVMSLDNIGELEALMSSSCVGIVSSESVFPVFVDGAVFDGVDITHPLLDPSKAVSNSVSLKAQTALITGSNMSGKTTLIRTVGICTLLALTGAPVPAKSLKLGRMRIVSSMRIVDSIEGNMSTFKAELVRIARIIESAKEETPLLYLIDEIFRGTNSTDRTEGALTVLCNLAKPHIMGMMTTHDYALCDKVEESLENIVYYHFSETYNDKGISFDYKLHNGVSHESNAKYLMKLVGITR